MKKQEIIVLRENNENAMQKICAIRVEREHFDSMKMQHGAIEEASLAL